MSALFFKKVVSSLPSTLTPNTYYNVRTGAGFDLYLSDSTGTVAHKINAGPASVGENLLINPEFVIYQEGGSAQNGTVTLTAGQYGHDGWKAGSGGCTYTFGLDSSTGTMAINIQSGTLISIAEITYSMPLGSVVLSWTGTAQGRINNGSYGSSGVSLTSASGFVQISVEFGVGTLTKVKLEFGSTPTPYRKRLPSEDFLRCAHYFYAATSYMGVANGYTDIVVNIQFPLPMRTTPTVFTKAPIAVIANGYQKIQAATNSNSNANKNGAWVALKGFTGLGYGSAHYFANVSLPSQYLYFDARL